MRGLVAEGILLNGGLVGEFGQGQVETLQSALGRDIRVDNFLGVCAVDLVNHLGRRLGKLWGVYLCSIPLTYPVDGPGR